MSSEHDAEISMQISIIDRFLERTSVMLSFRDHQKFTPGLQFDEQELKRLDQSLISLVARLSKQPVIDDNVWMPPVAYAYRIGYEAREWGWLESFFEGLNNSKSLLSSYLTRENGSSTYYVSVHGSTGTLIGPGRIGNIIYNQGLGQDGMNRLVEELSALRKQMKLESNSPEEDIATASVAAAEISAKKGDEEGVWANLKKAGQWAFDVATKIGISVAAKVIEDAIGSPR